MRVAQRGACECWNLQVLSRTELCGGTSRPSNVVMCWEDLGYSCIRPVYDGELSPSLHALAFETGLWAPNTVPNQSHPQTVGARSTEWIVPRESNMHEVYGVSLSLDARLGSSRRVWARACLRYPLSCRHGWLLVFLLDMSWIHPTLMRREVSKSSILTSTYI